jgi:hypothetical protein
MGKRRNIIMTVNRYFDKYPLINYANNLVIDITKRVTLVDKVTKNPYIFYPYDISNSEREDQLSARYYGDPYKSWILYLSNNITDPYYEWYLSDEEFNEFIISKYGSIENSMQKIKFYRNHYSSFSNLY